MLKKVLFYTIATLFCKGGIDLLWPSQMYSFPSTSRNYGREKVLVMGSIQYPMEIEKIPLLRIYCGGNKIKCETSHDNKKLTFAFNEYRGQSEYYILVAEQIEFITENNVVLYLKIPMQIPYKLYVVKRIPSEIQKKNPAGLNELDIAYQWDIQEVRLTEERRIPDNAIIICDNPHHIAEVLGGVAGSEKSTAYELPKVVMRSDLLQIVGSEKKLHEYADMLRLAAIDSDTIHSWRHSIKSSVNKKAKTIVALTT